MKNPVRLLQSLFVAFALLFALPLAGSNLGLVGVQAAQAQTVQRISVEGNVRVDRATIVSYLAVRTGEVATSAKIRASIDSLFNTGLFEKVSVSMSGSTLRVAVTENPIVSSVLFEGNNRFSDKELLTMVDVAARGAYSDTQIQSDVQSIRLAYDQAGFAGIAISTRVEPVDNGRVRVVFVIGEGERAQIAAINFTGNTTYRADALKNVIRTKETHFMSWLFKDDAFDEDILAVDKELIRLYYANHGFPDAQVLSAVADFDVTQNAYFINFAIVEGERYSFGSIGIETSISGLNAGVLRNNVKTGEGGRYSYAHLQETVEDMTVAATGQGFPFANVRPRIDRDVAAGVFNVTYLVDNGPRVYVERINIYGNTKTRDFVIRRELDFAEGDPFNRTLVARGRSSIQALGYFSIVDITTEPGSSADKVVINIVVKEQSTGDYGATIGYSTNDGVLGELSLTESNFLGRGQYFKVSIGATQSGQTYQFAFTEPRFMGLKISAGVDVYQRIQDETADTYYGATRTGGQFRVGVPITNIVSSTIFAGFEHAVFAETAAPVSVVVADGDTLNKAFVGYTLVYNGVDDVKRPTEGLYATFTQQYVGLDHNYIKTVAKARYFTPLFEDSGVIASVKGQAGIISDLSGAGVDPTEAFMLGSNLVRGFAAGGIGPRVGAGGTEPLGALMYAGLSAEVEFPLPVLPESYGLKGAVWADAGYVGGVPGGLAAGGGETQPVRASLGASLIWDSPFGPLRGDFGWPVLQDAADETQWFSLTISTLL